MTINNDTEHEIGLSCIEQLMPLDGTMTGEEIADAIELATAIELYECLRWALPNERA